MYYFVTVLLILLSANSTFVPFYNIDWFIVEFIFIWIGIEYNRFTKKDLRFFLKFAVIYMCFCGFRSIFLLNLPSKYFISDVVYLFKYILPSFLFCAVLKDKAIYYLSRVISDGAAISLCFFAVQLVAGELLFSIGKTIGIPPVATSASYDYTNFIVFNFVKLHPTQNSGFAWEPGAFGFFLNLGLAMHFLTNGFVIDKRAKWMIIAIITTVSTTSFIALIVVFLMFFRARGVKFNRLVVLAVPVFCVAIFQLPFLADKIVSTYIYDMESLRNIEFFSAYYIKIGEQFPLNRFATLIFIYKLFGSKLIFGISNIYNETQAILSNISLSNGIFEFCARFGLIGLLFLLYRGYLFFRTFTVNFEQAFYCIILVLILGFGESIFVLPLATTFCFLYYYAEPVEEKEFEEEEFELNNAA